MIALPINRSARGKPQPAPLERGGTHLDGDRPRRAGTASPSPPPTVDSSSFEPPTPGRNQRRIRLTKVTRTGAQS